MSEFENIFAISNVGFDSETDYPSKIESENTEIEMKDMSNTNENNSIFKLNGVRVVPHSKKLQEYLEGNEIKGEIVYQKCKTCKYDTSVLDTWDECDKICGNCEASKEKLKNSKRLNASILKSFTSDDNLVARMDKDGNIIMIKQ